MSFIAELRRRNVFRVGIAHAVGGWLLLQLTEVLSELLKLPDEVGPIVVTVVVVGFPIALFFAWAYELTPEGMKRESALDQLQARLDDNDIEGWATLTIWPPMRVVRDAPRFREMTARVQAELERQRPVVEALHAEAFGSEL